VNVIFPYGNDLSNCELMVLRYAAKGFTVQETADERHTGNETVKTQRKAVIRKLRARNMIHAVSVAYQKGILE
jgi:DNA-binding NarL/FixJ family response regulator